MLLQMCANDSCKCVQMTPVGAPALLSNQGFSPEDVPFLLTRHPAILSAAPEQRLLRNLQWLAGKGAGN